MSPKSGLIALAKVSAAAIAGPSSAKCRMYMLNDTRPIQHNNSAFATTGTDTRCEEDTQSTGHGGELHVIDKNALGQMYERQPRDQE